MFFKFRDQYQKSTELDPGKETVTNKYPWYYLNTYVTNVVDGRVYVVDGQQRLTTLSLVLLKLHRMAKSFNSKLTGWLETKIAGQSGFEKEFWMNHVGHKQAQQDLFDGKNGKDVDVTSGISAANMAANFDTISNYLDKELKGRKSAVGNPRGVAGIFRKYKKNPRRLPEFFRKRTLAFNHV